MFNTMVTALVSVFKTALTILAGATAANVSWDIPPAIGSIQDIEPGDGPAWGTLSGLSAHPTDPRRLYAVTDQDSPPLRIVEIELAPHAAKVIRQIEIVAGREKNLDPEGIVATQDGTFWLASEGSTGNVPANRLLKVNAAGQLMHTINLPAALAPRLGKKGLEGITLDRSFNGERLVVAFQAPFDGDPEDCTRIGAVDAATGIWSFYLYPLDRTDAGELTGLSEVLHLRDRSFAAIERDGRGGKKSIKWITAFDLPLHSAAAPDATPPRLAKRRALDLVPLFLASARKVEKEVEGLALASDGNVYALTDNDNERATVLLRLGRVAQLF